MTGIDSVAAALLASRLDSLLTGTVSAPAGGGAASQVGTPGAGASSSPPAGSPSAAPPASTQTALSDVGRVLDAISRSGGDATPAIVGRLPLLADPTVLLTETPVPARAPAASGPAASSTPASAEASSTAAARDAAAPPPVAALRAALAQAVSESGLFYESHLAQWLAGQRPLAALMREPQARLATALAPVPADPEAVPREPTDVLDELLAPRPPLPAAARATAQPPAQGGAPARDPAQAAPAAARPGAPSPPDAADPLAAHADTHWTPARAGLAAASSDPQAQPLAPVHPAAVPLVRQQLDALATDQFRWTGEAWPGARLDWTIEPDEPGHRAPRGGGDDDTGDGIAWRTRLTLTLPSLGTVDAELVLNGAQLVARLRANQTGADRLTRNEAALRQRLEGSGLKVGGLSIRAVDDGPDGFDLFAAQAAAAAYARGAADVRVPGDDDEAL
ncbi:MULTISPECIES: flagellar hook-length control protein FliK [Burkholderia]|uniref:Flagellar hook-length control protein FliK n=1 Tax=Burkholderia anthinoferrum TaxID=3090833 RepID=A0ABU5WS72_9BURK|nr:MULTISPECIES: flagellar hook-length control protein FliK [Burkholderia]MEB2563056.1 flagellar hook-length control protein FliK [Burkholderia anthinoferrum]MEB2581721.1 flagellar hook-length control protein FliK [Burkholderia anthinoferrum]KVH04648.1 ribonuclease E [Burkholderia anthina]KVH06032.1 ribonuclease E [Burkholderia anthina]KVM95574.1 ribonuclease E [Burkholderia anthina]